MTRLPAAARRAAVALSLALLGGACHDATSPKSDLVSAVRVWHDRGPSSYDVTIRQSCFCLDAGPVLVSVRAGAVVGRTVVATGAPLDPRFAAAYPDVDGLFAIIDDARRREHYTVTATYDRALGYPVEIDASMDVPDAGFVYYVTGFRRVDAGS